ncbi:MAG: NifB/NifX family molybdenum-iron cluster-binding protein [Kiritimatiellia bacterium]
MDTQIAVPYSDGQIFQHFGRTTQFKIYKIEAGKVASAEIIDTEGTGHEDLALWLVWHGVNGVICGNVGPGMQGALAGAGIRLFAGVEGAADEAVEKFLAGTLVTADVATCGGGHHGGECGGHCGHGCGGCHH